MHAILFATSSWTAFQATALKALAWIALLTMLVLVDRPAGRIAPSREESGPGSAGPGRRGGRADRDGGEPLARLSMTLVPDRPASDADELVRMGLLRRGAWASAPGGHASRRGGGRIDRLRAGDRAMAAGAGAEPMRSACRSRPALPAARGRRRRPDVPGREHRATGIADARACIGRLREVAERSAAKAGSYGTVFPDGRPRRAARAAASRHAGTRVSATRVPRANRPEADPRPSTPPAHLVEAVETPAFVLDEAAILRALAAAAALRDRCGCKVLYPLKPLACPFVLELMRPHLDGFATSSLFESRLARSVAGPSATVHVTTPGFRPAEIEALDALCDRITFNSLPQFDRLRPLLADPARAGLRINPRLSLVADERYDPCRPGSKLGVPIGQLARHWPKLRSGPDRLRGLHLHTNCDSDDWAPLRETVRRVEKKLAGRLEGLDWINLGGGYLLGPDARTGPLIETARRLADRYGIEVVIEPGAALVREAGSLVCEVIDLFRSGGRSIAVLDTTVNHMPEVFEYQFEPDVAGHADDADHEYLLVGSSCLAGDLLGLYAFPDRLRIGSRVVLPNLGAYALVKAHMFNGINLPTIYSVRPDGQLVLRRRFDYRDFLSRAGAPDDAAL